MSLKLTQATSLTQPSLDPTKGSAGVKCYAERQHLIDPAEAAVAMAIPVGVAMVPQAGQEMWVEAHKPHLGPQIKVGHPINF